MKFSSYKYLIDPDPLRIKLSKLKENLNSVLKEIDSIGLSNDYNTLLDEVLNPELKSKCKF